MLIILFRVACVLTLIGLFYFSWWLDQRYRRTKIIVKKEPKYCVNCLHFVKHTECHRLTNNKINLVTGLTERGQHRDALMERSGGKFFNWLFRECGPTGRYFVDKRK